MSRACLKHSGGEKRLGRIHWTKEAQKTSGQLLLLPKGTRRGSCEELQLNQSFFFNLNSAEEVFQTQLSALHKASITIPGQRTGTDPVCASSP